jgi:hypothetical protein
MIQITAKAPSEPPILALDATATAAKLGTDDVSGAGDVIRQVTALAESLVPLRWIWFRSYRAVLEGSTEQQLYLPAGRPIAVVSSVKLGNDGEPLTAGDDFEIYADDGFLYAESGWGARCDRWVVEWDGGWWTTSMGDAATATAAGATRLVDGAAQVEGAIFDIVKATWAANTRESGLKREEGPDLELEYFQGGVQAPKSAIQTICRLAPPTAF